MAKKRLAQKIKFIPSDDIEVPAGESPQEGFNDGMLLVYTQRRASPELSVYECGWEHCRGNHAFGPTERSYYILHFIIEGRGEYTVKDRTYSLAAGDIFVVPPEITTFYHADREQPWSYYWVGFNGLSAKYLLSETGIADGNYAIACRNPDRIASLLHNITTLRTRTLSAEYAMLGHLYLLLSELMEGNREEPDKKESDGYIAKAVKFMNESYASDIGVTDVARYVGLERSYFFKLFKNAMGVSPREYLIDLRLRQAQILIKHRNLPLHEVATAVGYDNYTNFCKMFRRKCGLSPREYALHPHETD